MPIIGVFYKSLFYEFMALNGIYLANIVTCLVHMYVSTTK